jgi:hypothetical protein
MSHVATRQGAYSLIPLSSFPLLRYSPAEATNGLTKFLLQSDKVC